MDVKTGYFLGANNDSAAVVLGFIPDSLDLINLTTMQQFFWSKSIADASPAQTGQFGIGLFAFSAGTSACGSVLGDESDGISAYDASGDYVNVESPVPVVGKVATPVTEWEAASVLSGNVIRTATAIGKIIRPTSRNGFCYELVATNGGDSTMSATEPTWTTTIGNSTQESTAGETFDWMCRTEEIVRGGGKGFVMGSSILDDADVWAFRAFRTDKDRYIGDMDTGTLSIV